MRSARAGLLVCGCLGTVLAAPAYAVDNQCQSVEVTTPAADTSRPSAPYDLLGIAAAQDQVRRFSPPADEPVRVAVVSSGVRFLRGVIPLWSIFDATGANDEVSDPQGTEIAGLISGVARQDGQPVGFAPAAQIVDVRVYLDRESTVARERPSTTTLASGLSWIADHGAGLDIKVAVVPFAVRKSPQLRAAVARVLATGIVLVAATGDRPADGTEFSSDFDDPPAKDEDAAELFYPAGYPGVVAVNATGVGDPAGALASVVKNSRTTVAAPTYDAVSYGLNGHSCVVQPTSTAAAAGEVAGVLALLWQRFPKDTRAQIVSRLVNTADGTTDDPTPLTGAGVVQPYEALTRPLAPSKTGQVERTAVRPAATTPATAPAPEADLLASTRDHAVWWGLIGGGLLVVALMLRPVLARRRS